MGVGSGVDGVKEGGGNNYHVGFGGWVDNYHTVIT